MNPRTVDGVWYPDVGFVETVVTQMVPVLFPGYDISEPDFQFLGGQQGRGLLASSLARPLPYYGVDRYPTLADKASALVWSIVLNHPFNDGNKRAALTTAFIFLVNNRQIVFVNQDEAVEMCLRVAANTPGYTEAFLATWIGHNLVTRDNLSSLFFAGGNDESRADSQIAQYWAGLTATQRSAWLRFYDVLSTR